MVRSQADPHLMTIIRPAPLLHIRRILREQLLVMNGDLVSGQAPLLQVLAAIYGIKETTITNRGRDGNGIGRMSVDLQGLARRRGAGGEEDMLLQFLKTEARALLILGL